MTAYPHDAYTEKISQNISLNYAFGPTFLTGNQKEVLDSKLKVESWPDSAHAN